MFTQADSTVLSATDLINYLGCRHATFLDLSNLRQPIVEAKPDATQELLIKKGLEHEKRHLNCLIDQGKRIAMIDPYATINQRIAQTIAAMANGADVIYQGALLDVPWMGYADFLVRVDGRTRLGSYGYEVVDTKLARSAQPKHIVQLCVYSRLLGLVQERLPVSVHVVLGDGSQVTLPLSHFLYYAELAQRRLERFAACPPQESFGEPCGHCSYCRWNDLCAAEWERIDHLSLVANITRNQIAKLRFAGVDTVRKLSRLTAGATIPKMPVETVSRLRQQARLQVSKRDTGKDSWELLDAFPGKGFARMPKPDARDLFFDMEGDPFADDGLEYLFGFAYLDKGEHRFKAFWAHSRSEEKQAFERAVDFIVQRLARFPDAHIYHYASYEESALKRLSILHGTRESEIDNLLRRRNLVDLYKVVREAIRISEPRYSIKNLETFYMATRKDDVSTAGDSIVVYEQWRELRDPALLKQIEDYNATDCYSTLLLRDWLLSLRPKATPWFTGATEEEEQPVRSAALAEAEARRQNTTGRLLNGVSDAQRPYRELVTQLLEFYRREAKPQWWARFNWQDSSEEELINDSECIGGLRPLPGRPPVPNKRSLIHTFRFPAQDYKQREGDLPQIAESFARAGEIVELNDESLTMSLRIGNNAPPFPPAFSLIPGAPINTDVLREAIYRYAEAVIAGGSSYKAITSFLTRRAPAVAGVKPGYPVIEGETTIDSAVTAICNLTASYMLVQGPPGAGKTFTAARAIVELFKRGKRIGVSSNSHKAINTLLSEVEAVAKERKVKFRGVKKSSDDDHRFDGELIEDATENKDVFAGDYDLIAGTAWLFARDELDQALDYLFIDEAGQVSLAHVVAMGVCARNIVLIGDQMQLAQPTQGVHPGESGLSALEYALGDLGTVPPSLGIFLDKTRRMHPDVCRFISDAFYDGRLLPDSANARQRLTLAGRADEALASTGIRFVEVEHADCSQSSEAEAESLNKVYRNLLKQRWIDRDGKEAPVRPTDILVVSPYNMQVDLLRRALPDGARIGTVDKFQGQEAAVVLISMATSSSEDMPRNIEFLFSRNRLNVAISRARCLAVIFANPRLLETPCSSIEQMRLVNALCWARAYAGL
jgi:predicted RecB family nuclease